MMSWAARMSLPVRTAFAYQLLVVASALGSVALLGGWASLGLTSSGEAGEPTSPVSAGRRPTVLLFTLDTLRADHVGVYGYPRGTTPQIDRLAREGVVFGTAYAPMGTTCPSHATLFTSRDPLAHGVVRNGLRMLAEEETLAERMRALGYRTAGFVSSFPVSRAFGFEQGFDVFDDRFGSHGPRKLRYRRWGDAAVPGRFDRPAEQTATSVLRWLETAPRNAPWFVWVHLFDPHGPYTPPIEFAAQFMQSGIPFIDSNRALYDGEIRYMDSQVGRIVDAFEAAVGAENLLLAITSDHGQGLFDHGWGAHNRTVYEEEVRVPLVFRWPGRIPAGGRRDVPAHLLDVTPTILGWLGIEQEALQGVDWTSTAGAADRPLFLLSPQPENTRPGFSGHGVRLGPWKFIHHEHGDGAAELYDLATDPRERENLVERHPALARRLQNLVADWKITQLNQQSTRIEPALSTRKREALRALGYLDESQ